MPIREYICLKCGNTFDFFEIPSNPEEVPQCEACDSYNVERQLTAHGGYSLNSGGSSTRPSHSGSFRKAKK